MGREISPGTHPQSEQGSEPLVVKRDLSHHPLSALAPRASSKLTGQGDSGAWLSSRDCLKH